MPAALRVRFLRTACPACWLLDVSRPISSRMVFRAQGESPAPRSKQMRAARKRESCNASAAKPINLGNDKYTNVDAEPASDCDAGPGADADAGPGRVHHLGNKQVFRPASRRTLAPCPPPRLGTRRARVRTRRYLWTVQAPRPACTMAVFHHLRADASYLQKNNIYRKLVFTEN